jgi:enamine deaminase RidA (YjgF/YER057c/UK114 family)
MPHLCVNPTGIDTPKTYSHVIVARGSRMVFIAGQYPEDAGGHLVGPGDMAVQARQAFTNLAIALASVGARPEHVTRLGIFVANYKREYLALIEQGRVALFGEHKPTDVLVGVASLANSDYLIEVDAIAVIDDGS